MRADHAVTGRLEVRTELPLAGRIVVYHQHGGPEIPPWDCPGGGHLRRSAGSLVKSRSPAIRMKEKALLSWPRRRKTSAYIMQISPSFPAAFRSFSNRRAKANCRLARV